MKTVVFFYIESDGGNSPEHSRLTGSLEAGRQSRAAGRDLHSKARDPRLRSWRAVVALGTRSAIDSSGRRLRQVLLDLGLLGGWRGSYYDAWRFWPLCAIAVV